MKVLLDIKDSKVDFVMELLGSLSFVKAEPLTAKKSDTLKGLKKAVEEVNLIKAGKKKSVSLNSFLDGL
jgi:hypothetical protein